MDQAEKRIHLLAGITILVAAGVFTLDHSVQLGITAGLLYLLVVVAASWLPKRKHVLVASLVSTFLVFVDFDFSPPAGEPWADLGNQALVLFAIWITAIVSLLRKQVEAADRQSAARYRQLVDLCPDPLFVSVKGKLVLGNSAALQLLRAAQTEQLIGKSWADLVPADHKDLHQELLRKAEAGQSPPRLEEKIMRLDGTSADVEVAARRVVFDDQPAVQTIMRDVTERKRAEEALAKERNLLRTLMDNLPEYIYLKDRESRFVVINSPQVAIRAGGFGLMRPEEMVGKTDFDLLPKELAERFYAEEQNLIRSGQPILNQEMELSDPKGDRRWLVTTKVPLRDSQGSIVGLVGVTHDTTIRKRAEQKLAASENRLRTIFESEPECVKLVAADGTLLEMNPAGLAMIEADTLEQVRGQPILPIIAPEHRSAFWQVHQEGLQGKSRRLEFEIIGCKGTRRWVEMHAVPHRDETNQIAGVLSVTRDFTERKRLESRQAAFAQLGQNLSSAKTPGEAARIIVEVADKLFGWDAAGFNLVGPDQEQVIAVLNLDLIHGQRADVPSAYLNGRLSPFARRVVREGAQLILRAGETRAELGLVPFGDPDRSSASLMFVPLRHGGKVLGILTIQSYTPKAYTERDLETLQSMADFCGGCLERIEAEEAFRESEERYRTLVEQSPDAIVVYNEEKLLYVNPAVLRLYGSKSPRDLIGRNVLDLVHPDFRQEVAARVKQVLELGAHTPLRELKVLRADGEEVTVEGHSTPVSFQGQPAVQTILRDVTERKRAEEALRHAEAMYRSIFENAIEGIFQSTPEGRYLSVNPALAQMLGHGSSEELVASITDIGRQLYVDPACRHEFNRRLEQDGFVSGFEAQFYRKDGQKIWVTINARAVRDASGALLYYEGTNQNITARREAEEQIRLLADALESSSEMIAITDLQDRLTYVNQEFLRTYGYAREEILGQPSTALDSPRNASQRLAEIREQSHRDGWKGELVARRKDGADFPVFLSASVVRNLRGEVIGRVSVGRDITERLQMQEQLLQAQKMEGVGRLAGGIAHDFNNLLQVILGCCDLLLNRLKPEDPLHRDAQLIKRAGTRASALTQQLLAFSRKQVLLPKVIDLNALIAETNKMLRPLIGEDIEIVMVLSEPLEKVKTDPGQMTQVIMNLAINARDAMPKGGKLTLETTVVHLSESFAQAHPGTSAGAYVMMSISDTGCGMSEDVKSHLFEPFFTTKEIGKGTGLGLSTVYGIVKQSGGHVVVESDVDRGTTVRIYLPKASEAFKPADAPTAPREMPKGTETVLLVEDADAVRHLLTCILERHGYRVIAAINGAEALQIAERRTEPMDLLITDIVMPQMNGRELSDHLKRQHPDLKVLYISGYTDDILDQNGSLPHGAAFLQKPFTSDTLLRKVRELIEGKSTKVRPAFT